ncbi:hypothetical protein RJT34_33487 [Clitoria ternatea]|uniref:Uncharacterized protein n=1 Tax=Clitoria ternatea TaxID=43366 RepID=A0AAN9F5Z8_CLITE
MEHKRERVFSFHLLFWNEDAAEKGRSFFFLPVVLETKTEENREGVLFAWCFGTKIAQEAGKFLLFFSLLQSTDSIVSYSHPRKHVHFFMLLFIHAIVGSPTSP